MNIFSVLRSYHTLAWSTILNPWILLQLAIARKRSITVHITGILDLCFMTSIATFLITNSQGLLHLPAYSFTTLIESNLSLRKFCPNWKWYMMRVSRKTYQIFSRFFLNYPISAAALNMSKKFHRFWEKLCQKNCISSQGEYFVHFWGKQEKNHQKNSYCVIIISRWL